MHSATSLFTATLLNALLACLLLQRLPLATPFVLAPVASLKSSRKGTVAATAAAVAQRPVDSISYQPSLQLDQEEPFDTIVIGSGIGGLATAAILAQSKEKHRVLVLEQHYRCGGCCHTFTKKGYKFGTGIHYVGEVGPDENNDVSGDANEGTGLRLRELLQGVTPAGVSIPWSAMDANYDTVVIGETKEKSRRYKIYAKEHQERLKEQFPSPKDQEAIDKYFALCAKAKASLPRAIAFKMMPRRLVNALIKTGLIRWFDKGYHKYATMTLQQVVDSLTDNHDLRTVLEYNWGDYGSLPSETPFLMHTLLVAHYGDGAYYPTGGSDVIPQTIIPVITARGGKVLANAPVRRILMDDDDDESTHRNSKNRNRNTARGVELMDGTKLYAKRAVVSDAGILNTCRYLIPPSKARDAMMKRLVIPNTEGEQGGKSDCESKASSSQHIIENGATGLCLFVGLKGDHDSDLQLPHSQIWMYPSDSIETDMQNIPKTLEKGLEYLKPWNLTPLFVGSPSGKDGDWSKTHPGKSSLEIITSIPWTWFEKFAPSAVDTTKGGAIDLGGKPGLREMEYKQAKEKLAAAMWARARQGLVDGGASERHLPETIADVDTYVLGTPLTYAHYLWNDKGAWYGLDHNVDRFRPSIFFGGLRPETEIRNLFMSGQDITISSLAGALCGGYLCATKILGRLDPFSLLKEVEHNRVFASAATAAETH